MKNATKKNSTKTAKATTETKATATPATAPAIIENTMGPNAKFPFAVQVIDTKGAVSFERFKTQKERNKRLVTLQKQTDIKASHIDYAGPVAAPAPAKKEAAKKADKPAAKKAAKKEAKPKDDTLRVRLYAKGEFYFGRLVAARIGELPNMAVEVKGKTVTLTPTKSTKDTLVIGKCHANPVLRAAKLLVDTGWSKTTQDLVAKPVGDLAFSVEVK
jgi:hypothetical protein